MKNAVVVIVVLIVLAVGGYYYMKSKGVTPQTIVTNQLNKTTSGVFTSIKDALSKSLSLKCVYKDDKGVETTTYIKGGAVRVMMSNLQDPTQPNNVIMKDKKMYMWSDANKTGFTLVVEEPKNVSPVPTTKEEAITPTKESSNQQESFLAEIEKYKNMCKPEVVADSQFAIPTDVKFQDMNALQNEMMKGLPNGQIQFPLTK